VSWQLAAFSLLALALAGGAGWYERTRPSAKLVALVATLGAFAALGRIAFAPLPNVKPTTDIVLVTGVALGGAPAFVVGAVAALASNLFFGQGYWTPWQMLGWGLVGLGGAALGRLTRRHPNRVVLALAGAVAGMGFGAIMNLSTWVGFSEHSLDAYLAMAGSALPFDIAHAVGNVLFALAFGPALLRAIARFRERFEVTWRPSAASAGVPLAVVLAVALAAEAASPAPARAASSVSYLQRAQNADGGWGPAPGASSSQLYTGWTALGLAAAGRNPLDVRRGSRSALSYIRRGARGITDVGEIERTVLVLDAAGVSPRDVGGRDLVAALLRFRRGDGSINGQVVYSSFGVLALRAAGRRTGDRAVRAATAWIARQQNTDGGFNVFRRGGASGVDETGAAVQALVAGGRRGSKQARRAVRFLRGRQNPDGGFPAIPGGRSNAQSTAYAAQALDAAGADAGRATNGRRSPLAYLRSLTGSGGGVRYSRTSVQTPVWVTAQALLALSRRPFPLPRVRAASVAPFRGGGGGSRGGTLSLDQAVATGGSAGGADARADRTTPPFRPKARAKEPAAASTPPPLAPAALMQAQWARGAPAAGLAVGVLFALIGG
jgi:Squalene-hopene cyclase C-terminal domain/Prenyltransferase and squalene oxidase repeat